VVHECGRFSDLKIDLLVIEYRPRVTSTELETDGYSEAQVYLEAGS
jgi:hypothetical protein